MYPYPFFSCIRFLIHVFCGYLGRCLEDEMNGKHERMKLVARQSQLLSSITELAVSLRRPPQDVVPALFLRLDVSSQEEPRGGVKVAVDTVCG